jgi:hypothetical protein
MDASPFRGALMKCTWLSHEDASQLLLQSPHVLPKAGQGGPGRRCGRTPVRPARVRPAVLACLPLTNKETQYVAYALRHAVNMPTSLLTPMLQRLLSFHGGHVGSPQQLRCTHNRLSSTLRTRNAALSQSTCAVSIKQCVAASPRTHRKVTNVRTAPAGHVWLAARAAGAE